MITGVNHRVNRCRLKVGTRVSVLYVKIGVYACVCVFVSVELTEGVFLVFCISRVGCNYALRGRCCVLLYKYSKLRIC